MRDLVDTRTTLIGTILSEAGDAAVNDPGIDLFHGLVVNAEPVFDGGAVVLHHDIGGFRHLEKNLQTFRRFQVEGQAALIPVQVLKVRPVAPAASRVNLRASRRFDLDHIGTPIGELTHCSRSGAVCGQVEYCISIERQGAGRHR